MRFRKGKTNIRGGKKHRRDFCFDRFQLLENWMKFEMTLSQYLLI